MNFFHANKFCIILLSSIILSCTCSQSIEVNKRFLEEIKLSNKAIISDANKYKKLNFSYPFDVLQNNINLNYLIDVGLQEITVWSEARAIGYTFNKDNCEQIIFYAEDVGMANKMSYWEQFVECSYNRKEHSEYITVLSRKRDCTD